jgi:hypothetical protein
MRNSGHNKIMQHAQFLSRFQISPVSILPRRHAAARDTLLQDRRFRQFPEARQVIEANLFLEANLRGSKPSQPCLVQSFLQSRKTKNLTARPWTNRRIICLIKRLCRPEATPMSLHSLFGAHQLLFGRGSGKGHIPSMAQGYPQAADVELSRWNR